MMATPTQLTRPTPKGPMAVHASPTPLLPAAQPDVLAPSLRRGAHGSTTSMDCLVETDTAPEAPPLHVDTAFTQYVRSDASRAAPRRRQPDSVRPANALQRAGGY
jgi:hypothetical protein